MKYESQFGELLQSESRTTINPYLQIQSPSKRGLVDYFPVERVALQVELVERVCADETNVHIKYNPLREGGIFFYQRKKNRLLEIGNTIAKKRQLNQKREKQNCAREMNIQFRALQNGSSTKTELPDTC